MSFLPPLPPRRTGALPILLCVSLAAALPADAGRAGAWLTYWDFDRGQQRLASAPSLFDDVFFFAFELGPDGRPAVARASLPLKAAVSAVRGRGARAWMTVVNDTRSADGKATLKDAAAIQRMLADAEERAAHRHALVELAALHGFSGVDVDYENLLVEDRDRFSDFIRELRGDLGARGLELSVTVQPKRQESRSTGPGAADWAALCRSTDRLQIMLYNLHNARTPPGPVTAPGWFSEVLAFARGQCGEATVVPVLKLGAMDWGPQGMKELQHAEVAALLEMYGPRLGREPEGATPYFRYDGRDGAHTVYFEDAQSILAKVAALERLGYDDVVLWSLGREDPALIPELQARKGPGISSSSTSPSTAAGVADEKALAVLAEQEARFSPDAPSHPETPVPRTVPTLFASALALVGLPVALALATPAATVTSPFLYTFNSSSELEEAGSMSESESPYFWLSSGGRFYTGGIGETVHASLPTNDYWRLLYAKNNPLDTDNGYHPQNVFRLVTRSRWGNARQQVYFRIAKDNLSASPNRAASNGVLLFNRYKDENNLYYTGVRVDGAAVIKKKIAGKYYTIAYRKIFPGAAYDRVTNPSLLPKNVWMGLTAEVLNRSDGSVRLRVHVNQGDGVWALVFDVLDDGRYGGAPFAQTGYGGLRTDFMDVDFENYLLKAL
ncbi:MAG TPA: glycosyl hydrolase family 18 protein [Vicinamibacteria bacterium]|nr:glycosyl hydrolase family 18 protein [Vicinamibacteria bacterium]